MQTYTVAEPGKRLDVFVQEVSDVTRSFAGKLCANQKIQVNGQLEKPSYHVRTGDIISVDFDATEIEVSEKIDLPIIYEDDDVLVINKPIGVLSHSKGAYNPEATVATFMEPKLHDLDGERGGIVHRLDRATSGVMICAKNQAAMMWLQVQFSSRKVQKSYVAVITGTLDPKEAIIDMPIARNIKHPKTFHVNANGKSAITKYKVVKYDGKHSLVELEPQTGRTHQLRVHLNHQKHPIVGDTFYDGELHKRMLLHAHTLTITLPNNKRQTFVAEIPNDFDAIIHD